MENPVPSVGSTLSWNTFLSRTSVSTLANAAFSEQQRQSVHGLEDVVRVVASLNLRRYRHDELTREETLGEGETYRVERCATSPGVVVAVKHLRTNGAADEDNFRRRLSSVITEAQIMRHPPLSAHPNLPSALGYGWNLQGGSVIPFLVVEYAPLGTLREYLKETKPQLADVEVLLGDVASALSALHTCGIVHGDVKLDNVLVFPSWDRPVKALAKVTDFGHALILKDKSKAQGDDDMVKYGGTLVYNAPEVQSQDLFPIDRKDLYKCDIWAFGLLVWEASIAGKEYWLHPARSGVVGEARNSEELLNEAKRCLPARQLGPAMFLRVVLHKTIQQDPSKRAASIRDLPLFTRWNAGDLRGLEADLALHFEAPVPTYEMFRLDTGKEILWDHQNQIFQGLNHTHANHLTKDRGPFSWQIALCHHIGFGTPANPGSVQRFSNMAKAEAHPVAMIFDDLFTSEDVLPSEVTKNPGSYSVRISQLLRSDSAMPEGMPPLVRAFFDGTPSTISDLLAQGAPLSSSTSDGCSPFHWLFMVDPAAMNQVAESLYGEISQRLVDIPMSLIRQPHGQWPLQLLGSPLAVSISVNCLPAVKALLHLGASPFTRVYSEGQFPGDDPRSRWTAFHVAAKFHCSDILSLLLEDTTPEQQQSLDSLSCALTQSTTLERLAMHGPNRELRLRETIRLIRNFQPLKSADKEGRTALMEAIDFEDHAVVAALLHAEPDLASTPLTSPGNINIFTYPIHFAVQIAARRNVAEALLAPSLLNTYTNELDPSTTPTRDHVGRTLLHLAVTGSSSLVADWILKSRVGLVHVEDEWGRTPLHYCESSTNCSLLLAKDAVLDHADKQGLTALHRACYLGTLEVVSRLLERKPKLELRNNVFGTPLHCGVMSGSIDIVTALIEAGAPLNATDMRGNTAVHVAASLNRHNILRLLMQKGADPTIRNLNGRDARAIAQHAAKQGNAGILSILKHRDAREDNGVLKVDQQDTGSAYYELQSRAPDVPDFSWNEMALLANPDEALSDRPTCHSDFDMEREDTHDERKEKRDALEALLNDITSNHLPGIRNKHWAVSSLTDIISVYSDRITWQPGVSTRILEVMARSAHDMATILHLYYDEARNIRQRTESWARYLTKHDGVTTSLRLEAVRTYSKRDDCPKKADESRHKSHIVGGEASSGEASIHGLQPELLSGADRLEAVWRYMQEHDCAEIPEGKSEESAARENVDEDNGLGRRSLSLKATLESMEERFPINRLKEATRVIGPSCVSDAELENVQLSDPGNLLQKSSESDDAAGEKTPTDQNSITDEKTLMDETLSISSWDTDIGPSETSSGEHQDRNPEESEEEAEYQPCSSQGPNWCSHMNLAIDWVTTLAMTQKPRDMFPGRQDSDIEAMLRWEMRGRELLVPEPGVSRYTSTLFRQFPHLSGQTWRGNTPRGCFGWRGKHLSTARRRVPGESRWTSEEMSARDDFYVRLYSCCQERVKEKGIGERKK